jgi:hypothetical protein
MIRICWNNKLTLQNNSYIQYTIHWSNNSTYKFVNTQQKTIAVISLISELRGCVFLCNTVVLPSFSGMRVPFLRVGWNRQFLMMKEFGFVYDASMVAPFSDPPLWPYTLDHKIPHQCTGNNQRCPSRSYPGIWEMVMNQLAIEVWISELQNVKTCQSLCSFLEQVLP